MTLAQVTFTIGPACAGCALASPLFGPLIQSFSESPHKNGLVLPRYVSFCGEERPTISLPRPRPESVRGERDGPSSVQQQMLSLHVVCREQITKQDRVFGLLKKRV